MATVAQSGLPRSHLPPHWTLADLQEHLGGIPLARIRLVPPPGYATEEDVSAIQAREDRLCELVDGVLVEKPVGSYESILAGLILTKLNVYLETHDLGQALGADGCVKLLRGVVKIPDVCFSRAYSSSSPGFGRLQGREFCVAPPWRYSPPYRRRRRSLPRGLSLGLGPTDHCWNRL